MPRFILSAAAAWLVLSAGAARAQELTESVVLERIDESPAAEALRRRVDEVRAEGRLRTAPANPSIAYSREEAAGGSDTFITVRQELPISGRRGLLQQALAARVDAVEREVEGTRRRLRADARTAFTRALAAQEREASVLSALGELEELVRVLHAREREGESSAFDRRRAERELADLRRELASAHIARARSLGELQIFLASADADPALGGSLDPQPIPAATQLSAAALEKRAEYEAATALVESWRLESRAATRLRAPEPSVIVGAKRTAAPAVRGTGYTAGIEWRLPLFDRGGSAVAAAEAGFRRAQTERDALKLRIDAQVRTAHTVAETSRTLALQYAADVADSGTELARVARVAYEEGEVGILELLDASRVALDGRLHGIELRADARVALIDLEFLAGEEVIR